MNSFRYQAIAGSGATVDGVIEAEDRRAALASLGAQGLFPSSLEICAPSAKATMAAPAQSAPALSPGMRFGAAVKRKEITAFTCEMGALLTAAIPIPQALDGLGEEEENAALRSVILQIADSVRRGVALSTAMEEHPKLFGKLYVSMVRVGEEAGVLPKVMADLAALLEHEDEVRSEVVAAVSYPLFVLAFGAFTVVFLLAVVLPRLFGMLQQMIKALPLPTLILLKISSILHHHWIWVLGGTAGLVALVRWYLRSPGGGELWDRWKLSLPVIGPVFRAASLSRFARTLGTLVKSGTFELTRLATPCNPPKDYLWPLRWQMVVITMQSQ